VRLETLIPPAPSRTVEGRLLCLADPISFWGGVSPADGSLSDPRSTQHGESIAGTVLVIRELRGSSSASAVLLELIYRQRAPCAIVLAAPDAILALGVLVAAEMAWETPGIFRLPAEMQASLAGGARASLTAAGELELRSHDAR
jgi:predicted aconitase with swiveling domain